MPWFTITDSFDADFGVDEWHGTNVFYRDGERVFRTYFVNNRGDEQMGGTWNYLDITPLGRQEAWEDLPRAIRRPRPTNGGTGTTATSPTQRPTRRGSRCRTRAREAGTSRAVRVVRCAEPGLSKARSRHGVATGSTRVLAALQPGLRAGASRRPAPRKIELDGP